MSKKYQALYTGIGKIFTATNVFSDEKIAKDGFDILKKIIFALNSKSPL